VSWTRAARRAPLSGAPDTAVNAAETRAARTALNRAVKRAVAAALRQAPMKVDTGAVTVPDASAPVELEIDVSFVGDDEIAELNSSYRGKPRPTDVLSFSQREDDELVPGMAGARMAGLDIAGLDHDGGGAGSSPVMLGDIVISIETAQRQAWELKHDLLTEVTFLAVHGALHLCGYDHGTASDRRTMWKWQEAIVASLATSGSGSSTRGALTKGRKPAAA
jgi:probable rRNA maturation factor